MAVCSDFGAPGLLARIAGGDRRMLATTISALEADDGDDRRRLMRELYGRAEAVPQCHVVGVTGPPGAGKSSLIAASLPALQGRLRTAVVAIDPSSPLSGGALLGDRVRMRGGDMFFRSLASRGHEGSLADVVPDCVLLLAIAGYELVLVETVGAGQEVGDLRALVDTIVLAVPPGFGDEVQAQKAGILELADVIVVTKADAEESLDTTRTLKRELARGGGGRPILRISATSGEGMAAFTDLLVNRGAELAAGDLARRWGLRARERAAQVFRSRLPLVAAQRLRQSGEWDRAMQLVEARALDPDAAAERLMHDLLKG